jgi:hypothetical protein
MEHTLAISRLWAALTAALRETGVTVARWNGEGELRRLGVWSYDYDSDRHVALRPDGYLELRHTDKTRRPFFVEMDMGTETNDRVARKMLETGASAVC